MYLRPAAPAKSLLFRYINRSFVFALLQKQVPPGGGPDKRMQSRRSKRMKLVDLESTTGSGGTDSMFADVQLASDVPNDTLDEQLPGGAALFCFLSEETFVGLVELDGSEEQLLKVRTAEAA